MPFLVEKGLPVLYGTWAEWREDRSFSFHPSIPLRPFCSYCWGQGRIFEKRGRLYDMYSCGVCGGFGR